jgi:16S rRNA (uracil1498-N3)-methyltransferase
MPKTEAPKTRAAVRLYLDAPLSAGADVPATEAQAHYLLNVMRVSAGKTVALFNGCDGEWHANVNVPAKRRVNFTVTHQTRPQVSSPDVWLAFAPVKRIEFIAEKASELGVAALLPVFTRHTDVSRVNVERLRANAVEAAEQCERLSVPTVHEPVSFDTFITAWPEERRLYFLDETGAGAPIAAVLRDAVPAPAGFLTGPEGGFAQSELDALRQLPFATALGLGPRILRAETAALAALSCWQALLGDWRSPTSL